MIYLVDKTVKTENRMSRTKDCIIHVKSAIKYRPLEGACVVMLGSRASGQNDQSAKIRLKLPSRFSLTKADRRRSIKIIVGILRVVWFNLFFFFLLHNICCNIKYIYHLEIRPTCNCSRISKVLLYPTICTHKKINFPKLVLYVGRNWTSPLIRRPVPKRLGRLT